MVRLALSALCAPRDRIRGPRMRAARALAPLLALLWPVAFHAAPPQPPTVVPYQGLLLDASGQARTGPVDLTVRVYDAPTGGTLLYKQGFAAVGLADGVFSVELGPSGAATDTPADPLTTSLADALAGDLAATGPSRFVELTVGSEGALPRTQLLAVPYALRAEQATSADVAVSATSVTQVDGVDASVFSQIFQHFAFDGSDPPNDDPSEGLADVDGDGLANFIDPDNDGDGIPDATEINLGTNINLITPTITGFQPATLPAGLVGTVTVQGTNFAPGLVAFFGAQQALVSNVSATSFDAEVGPQPVGTVDVVVTPPNGEAASAPFRFGALPSGPAHNVTVFGTTQLTLDVDGATLVMGGHQQVGSDLNSDGAIDTVTGLASDVQLAVAWSPGGDETVLRCRPLTADHCELELAVDANGNHAFDDAGEVTPVETFQTTAGSLQGVELKSPDVRFDASGRALLAYVRKLNLSERSRLAWDRNGDGDFVDAGELIDVEGLPFGVAGNRGRLALDPSGFPVFLYGSGTNARLAWDRNGDGDFADTVGGLPELSTLTTDSALRCVGVAFDGAGRLAAAVGGANGLAYFHDTNGDGDFADAGETASLAGTMVTGCDVDRHAGGGIAVVHDADGVVLLVDADADGSFDPVSETFQLTPVGSSPVAPLAVRASTLGPTYVATPTEIYGVP